MKLIPVVDFSPTYFQTQEHEMPESSSPNAINEWHHYWKESLTDSGITNLEPYKTGSWLVEVVKLSSPVVETLLSKAYSLDKQTTDSNKFALWRVDTFLKCQRRCKLCLNAVAPSKIFASGKLPLLGQM
jgi:hypothetical protein